MLIPRVGRSPQRDLAALHRRSRSNPSPVSPYWSLRLAHVPRPMCGAGDRIRGCRIAPRGLGETAPVSVYSGYRVRDLAVPNTKLCPGKSVVLTRNDLGRPFCREGKLWNGVKLPGRKLHWVSMIRMHPWGGALDLPGYRRGQNTRNCREIM